MNVCIVMGLPGSGKSYFAKRLSTEISGDHLNSDIIRKKLFPLNRSYSDHEKAAVYQQLFHEFESHLIHKESIIIDATFHKKSALQPFLDLIERLDVHASIIKLQASEDLTRKRVQKTRPDSEADFDVYLKLKAQQEKLDYPHLVLDSTNENIEELINQALSYISKK